ncbi:hypothetical protein GCM10027052_25760 [Parafrigoribacterium mesophilum]|uniref:hypothetical protein n=1 Tax=Parafrigoribacterium mesophilum TaxID=433646 RepID=UPI0031FC9FDB
MNNDDETTAISADIDRRGVPLTVSAALQMTRADIEAALTAVLVDIETDSPDELDDWPCDEDGSLAFGSHLGYSIYIEFVQHLSRLPVDVTKVDRKKWTTIAGLAEVIEQIYSDLNWEATK